MMQHQCEQFYLEYNECVGSRCWNMSKNIWGDLLTERGYLIVPRELRLKRKELGLNNEEYSILLDYLDNFKYSGTWNSYQELAELNGVTEGTIQRRLGALEKKGLLRRELRTYKSGRIKEIVFSPAPLVEKLKSLVTDDFSDTDSELGNESHTKIRSAHESPALYTRDMQDGQDAIKGKKWKDEFCSTRWYNDVFSEMYEEASGQPVLTGGREYKSAEIYFGRLRQLNPDLLAEALFIKATEGALYTRFTAEGRGVRVAPQAP